MVQQVVTNEICSIYTGGVTYKPHCSTLMNKVVLKSHILSILVHKQMLNLGFEDLQVTFEA